MYVAIYRICAFCHGEQNNELQKAGLLLCCLVLFMEHLDQSIDYSDVILVRSSSRCMREMCLQHLGATREKYERCNAENIIENPKRLTVTSFSNKSNHGAE